VATVSLGGRPVPLADPLFQIRNVDMANSARAKNPVDGGPIRSATWFVPYFRHLGFGGIHTIFRFVTGLADRGVTPRIVIYDNPEATAEELRWRIVQSFPGLASAELVVFDLDRDSVDDLPATDIGVCTFWASAYLLLRFNLVWRKYYFIQDDEALFYLAGSTFALAESTYRFGFMGIVNTPGLLRALQWRYGLDGVSFVPAVDDRYFPPVDARREGRLRVFFYVRPGQARNAFELGLLVMRDLLRIYGDRIEIVTAGSEWNEHEYGLGGRITNMGLLNGAAEVSALYRTCDIGCVYSLSRHPSYQPLEFMASGMATVTNRNEDNLWLLRDGLNCLLAEPSPASMAEKITALIEDSPLRETITSGGLASVSSDWDQQIEHVWRSVAGSGS
jgi:glycosyltransferase involved in cell wall biosynthesis